MKPSALRREIWRDISTGTAWNVIFAIIASVLLTGLAAGNILLVSRINAQSCLVFSQQPEVHAIVAVRSPEKQLSAAALPSSSIRTYEATPGIDPTGDLSVE